MLTHGRNVTANRTESVCAVLGAKTARDFLLHLYHPNIPLGLIVVKRNGKVMHEAEDFGFVLIEPIKQVLWRGLFPASPSFGQGRWWWQIGGITFFYENIVTVLEMSDLLRSQGTRLLGGFCNLPTIANSS